MKSYPSIFNDVIGPVMRGPSSSHCAAALRIGRMCRDLMNGNIQKVYIEFDPNGSLATTHKGQGSDMGLFGGFLGWEADEERLPNYAQAIEEAGIQIKIDIHPIGATHPNTYKITLKNERETRTVTALSMGGGMIEVIEIDGATVSMAGDFYQTLVYCKTPRNLVAHIERSFDFDEMTFCEGTSSFIEIKSNQFIPASLEETLLAMDEVLFIKKINPVLPIMARKNLTVPFITCTEMLEYNADKNLELWELAVAYESERGAISKEAVFEKMRAIYKIMKNAIDLGLKGTKYTNRILGPQSLTFQERMDGKELVEGDVLNQVILYTSAMMEVKSSMGVIVAAPTAGSCGALPGALIGIGKTLKLSEDEMVKALLAAGMIGVFIAAHSTFAAEVGGCMAECGSGSGMAAAGIVLLKSGTLNQSLSAASMALQSSLGMICDMIADRVEAPCLNRNVMAATNAISCANMALSDYNHLIPLDEVVETMKRVGDALPNTLCCTGLGGLAITKTAKEIEAKLANGEINTNKTFFKVC
ncbi:L-serine ammonia-lyase, iron-sulfur-dependent, subunit alpha [Maribacter sp. PR1]|uniref:L-serine ammonia-lyase n=1 Tax=Maribacter cobaltidurans TaxID=1178778 RepID=A0ABU7IS66_9FLAO|nr:MULTISPECIES: L-serine ammonia-lyase, iron-sulfur-dependent, subunit alpha [Maribacter]MDC6388429.1 L-serine ammonia-lyase, iron-sulfur-dependent, subunit alpha [Maribacter sp. PR1]MEE1975818.1 L-serine ammonia-lyase, iron-sulfur-dependent, subunit alpha [Maribacter cobaltidurans]